MKQYVRKAYIAIIYQLNAILDFLIAAEHRQIIRTFLKQTLKTT